MSLLKNSYGVSIKFEPKISEKNFRNKFAGSSLQRKENEVTKLIINDPIEVLLKKPLRFHENDNSYEAHTMSVRTKSKIRKKVISFSRVQKRLTFVTLTFLNHVSDRQAIKILGAFLDNVSKRHKGFQYLWVVERQTKNKVFKDNVHFHLITNITWEIKRWWEYWIDVQKKYGVHPRDQSYKPSSAFDVKFIKSNDIKSIGNYITKYITKNQSAFNGSLWNCSKKISQLYTDFYSDMNFMYQLEKLQEKGMLKGVIRKIEQEHCIVYLVPLNNLTTHFYHVIDKINKEVWKVDPNNN